MTDNPLNKGQRAPFGVPMDEFAANSHKASAKAQVNQAVKLLDEAVKKAGASGLVVAVFINGEKVSIESVGEVSYE